MAFIGANVSVKTRLVDDELGACIHFVHPGVIPICK